MKRLLLTIAISAFWGGVTKADTINQEILSPDDAAQLAKIMQEQQIPKLLNQSFAPYDAAEGGAKTRLPLKLAIIGSDPLSGKFLKRYVRLLEQANWHIALIGTARTLRQLRAAYPNLTRNITVYSNDIRLDIMAHSLGIRYFPVLYDHGKVRP